jgi:hypothetical protein
MKIPRPLLILIVIIVILGVLSCGVGVFRGSRSEATPAPGDAAGQAHVGSLIDGPVHIEDITGLCVDATNLRISFTTSCGLSVRPVALLPRVLKLRPTSGTVTVSVRQEIKGTLQPDSPETKDFPPFDDVKISVSGSTPVLVSLTCLGTCELDILQ